MTKNDKIQCATEATANAIRIGEISANLVTVGDYDAAIKELGIDKIRTYRAGGEWTCNFYAPVRDGWNNSLVEFEGFGSDIFAAFRMGLKRLAELHEMAGQEWADLAADDEEEAA